MALSDNPGLPAHWRGETASDEVTREDAQHTYKEVHPRKEEERERDSNEVYLISPMCSSGEPAKDRLDLTALKPLWQLYNTLMKQYGLCIDPFSHLKACSHCVCVLFCR